MTETNFIDTKNLTLEEWLKLVYNPPKDKFFLQRAFPSDKHRDEYVTAIQSRSHEDVLKLLYSFLITSGELALDEVRFQSFIYVYKSNY